MRYTRLFLRQFMRNINALAVSRGATPKQYLGVPDSDDERSLLQTMILSQKAKDMGIVVTDENIVSFLQRYTDQQVQPGEFASELYKISQGRMSQTQFFNAMRQEMLALRFQDLFRRGIYPSTPAAYWDYFQRLNRQVRIEAVPFNVTQYLDRVDGPSDAEIARSYEAGKDRYSFPSSPTPGFKRRKQIALQYVQADLESFLEEEKAKITDEAIETYYNENKEQFRNAQLPDESDFGIDLSSDGESEITETEIDTTTTPSDGDAETTPEGDATEATTDDSTTDDSTTEESTEEEGVTDEDTSIEDETDESDASTEPPNADDSAEGGEDSGDGETDSDENSCEPFQEEEAEEQIDTVVEDDVENNDSSTPADDDASAEAAETDATTETATDDESNPEVTEESTDVAITEEENAGDESDSTAAESTSDDDLSDILGDTTDTNPDANEEPVAEFKSLEEVSDEIRTLLATPMAVERMEKAINSVRSVMRTYNGQYIGWDVSENRDETPQPTAPDLNNVAAKYGLKVADIPLVNIVEIGETDPITEEPRYPISQAYTPNFEPFAQVAFSDNLRVYEPRSIPGRERDRTFLFWKTAEVPEEVPSLDDCRDEVVRDLKMKAALKLAEKDAQAAAEQLRKNNQSPKDAYRNAPDKQVIEAGPFSWMTAPSVPYLPPRISQVDGIRYAGPEFMKEVFKLQQGEAGVATDNPEKTVYVVYLKSEASNMNQLRNAFLRSGPSFELQNMASLETRDLLGEWYTEYEKELDVEWIREPLADSRQR